MEVERMVTGSGKIELWGYDWDLGMIPPAKINRRFLAIEQPMMPGPDHVEAREAICWSYGRTLGNIGVFNEAVIGSFPAQSGDDAILECEIVAAGLWQNGNERWWCRTHQQHWGVKADRAAAEQDGFVRCASHSQRMSYIVDPHRISLEQFEEVGIWCSLPAAITSSGTSRPRHPRIHVHLRNEPDGEKIVDQDFDALTLLYSPERDLFANQAIDRVHLTPPAAMAFVLALEAGTEIGCVSCNHCGYPHLDLGEFARKPHRKHLCGNCGRDHTWTQNAMMSSPLKPIHDQFSAAWEYADVDRRIVIDDYPGAAFAVWASTPAIVWTARRPQERGIHVHLNLDGLSIDDTFGVVVYQGKELERRDLLARMVHNTLA